MLSDNVVMSGEPPGAPATCLPFASPGRVPSSTREPGYCDRIVVNSTVVDLLLGYLRSKKDAPKISVIPSAFVFCSQQHTRRRKTLFAVPINPSHPNALDLVRVFLLPRAQFRVCSRVASSLLVIDAYRKRSALSAAPIFPPPAVNPFFPSITICVTRSDHSAHWERAALGIVIIFLNNIPTDQQQLQTENS